MEKFNPDFIVVMNNDVEIIQEDFIERISRIYDKEKYGVLGPDIFSTYVKIHQNPKRTSSYSYEEIQKKFKDYKFRNESKIIVPLKCFLKNISFLKKMVQNKKNQSLKIDYTKKYFNIPLHGSCFIFSKDFIKLRSKAFFEGTFMYFESEILDYECHKLGLKEVYDPSVKVNHHHSVSSAKTYKSDLQKTKFINKCSYNSLKAFIDLMDKERN